jgi:hypothetical protein
VAKTVKDTVCLSTFRHEHAWHGVRLRVPHHGNIESDVCGHGAAWIGGKGLESQKAETNSVSECNGNWLLMEMRLLFSTRERGRYSAHDACTSY